MPKLPLGENNFSFAQIGLLITRLNKNIYNRITEEYLNNIWPTQLASVTTDSPIIDDILIDFYNYSTIDSEDTIREYIANEIMIFMRCKN